LYYTGREMRETIRLRIKKQNLNSDEFNIIKPKERLIAFRNAEIRLGYHLLLDEAQEKELGKKLNFKYPWLLKESISKNSTAQAKQIVFELRKRIAAIDPGIEVFMMSADELMRKALEINPVRKKKVQTRRKTQTLIQKQ
jgi:hypothetical protein